MQIVETMKAHPALSAGVAVGAVVLVLMLRGGSGGTVANNVTGDVATGDALAQAQLQSQHDIALAGISSQASGAHDAASLEVAKLDYEYKNNAAQIGANVGLAQINATLQALTTHDTLSAQVQTTQSNNQVQSLGITTNAATNQMRLITQALTQQAQLQANVAQSAIANQCHGFGCLF